MSYDRQFQPVLLIRVDGQDADDLVFSITNVEIIESSRQLAEVKISFPVPDAFSEIDRSVITDQRCQPGAQWSIRWGYLDDLAGPIHVVVTHFEPEFTEEGTITVELYLHSRGAEATRGATARQWGNVQSSDIARQIAERYGFDAQIVDSNDRRSTGHGYTQTAEQTDLAFLLTLAQRIHYVCWVEGNTLHYHPRSLDEAPVVELAWYGGQPNAMLKSVRPTVKAQPTATRRAGEEGHKSKTTGATTPATPAPTVMPAGRRVDLRDRRARIQAASSVAGTAPATKATPEQDPRVRRRHADAHRRLLLERVNEADIDLIGMPVIRPDRNILLSGVGQQLGGIWHVEEATHTLGDDGGYTTEAKIKRGAYEERAARTQQGPTGTPPSAATAATVPTLPGGAPAGRIADLNGRTATIVRPVPPPARE